MARIAEEVIERVKQEVSLVRLVELAGIELVRQGKDLVGCCPLVVSPEGAHKGYSWNWRSLQQLA